MNDLRVGIDVSPLVLSRAGTARYLTNLLAALEAEAGVTVCRYSFGGGGHIAKVARDTAWYLGILPHLARRDHLDLLHCPTFRAPVSTSVPLVVTVHDLAVLRHPEAFNAWSRAYGHLSVWRVVRAAARVIAVSNFTRRELVELLSVPKEKIRVVPNGVGRPFRSEGPAAPGDYVLAVSTLEPRKNLPRLVEGFRRAGLDDCELRVVGAQGWGRVSLEGERIRWLGEVTDDELARLYRGARCAAYISVYEGFGLPILEAMACGTPVVTSRGGACEEVAGSSGVLVDPLDPNSIAAGLVEALERRPELLDLGRKRASEFDWRRTAAATAAVYREVGF